MTSNMSDRFGGLFLLLFEKKCAIICAHFFSSTIDIRRAHKLLQYERFLREFSGAGFGARIDEAVARLFAQRGGRCGRPSQICGGGGSGAKIRERNTRRRRRRQQPNNDDCRRDRANNRANRLHNAAARNA